MALRGSHTPPPLPPGLPDLAIGRPLDPPIRSVLFGEARFESHGRSLALAHDVNERGSRGAGFFPRLQDNLATLQRALAALQASAAQGRHLSPAAHWLLDNASLLDEQLGTIRHALPRSFYRRLPVLREEPLAGLPRVYGVAWAWVAHADSGFDVDLLQSYLRAYQSTRPLTMSELWALHTTLRVVLLENLRRLAERTAARNAARDAAHAWADGLAASGSQQALPEAAVLAALEHRGVSDSFLLTLWQRLDRPRVEASAQPDLGHWLGTQLSDPPAMLTRLHNEAAEDQQSIRNAITTLRELERTDWQTLVAQCSAVAAVLARCPVHAAEHPGTQDATLHAVESLARESGFAEADVAHELLALTANATGVDDPRAAPAYWWQGEGEAALRRQLQLPRRRLPRRGSRAMRQWMTPTYLAGVTLLSGMLLWTLLQHADAAAPLWLLVLAGVLAAGPVTEAVVAVVNRLISESVPPTRLPRLAFLHGIPPEHASLVVMPVMLTTVAALPDLLAQLEQHALANPETHARFALLSDYADADAQSQPDDAALLLAAQQAVQALNDKHAGTPSSSSLSAVPSSPRFLLLHRNRLWCDSEQRWIGWERKRGKLEQLLRALVEPGYEPFVDLGALSRPEILDHPVRYVITLDADTHMPPGRLRALVGVAAHPLNQPRWESAVGRIVSGYGILQPRVESPLPSPETATGYHALFNGHCGLDPYSAASSEVYQDLFGEGSFSGKGLLNVQAVHSALALRLPEGQVLSHDLLEGSLARCAAVSEVTLVEDAPHHADVAASRLHRWTRGDWQLLPFLAGRLRLPLAGIHRWKMVDNLRRSLVAPASLLLLLLVLASGVLPLAWALGLVAAAFSAGPLIGAMAGLAPSRDDIAVQRFYREACSDLARVLLLAAWHLAQLLQLSMLYCDAVVRALWRQVVSRRHLLQWTTAASAQADASTRLYPLLRRHLRVPVAAACIGLALAGAAWAGAPVQTAAAITLLSLWALSAVWTWLVSRPWPRSLNGQLDAPGRDYVHDLARDTWRFYERHVTAEDQHLPPDNVQRLPHTMVAHRTSPTNIGLYLLAATCARELNFIGTLDLADRLSATLDTLERLPKHQGHLYNWVDTRTGAVLSPGYVSTVDSGNLAAFLLVVAQACDELALQPVSRGGATNPASPRDTAHVLRRARQRPHGLRALLGAMDSLGAVAQLFDREPVWPSAPEEAVALQGVVHQARRELDALSLGRDGGMPDGPLWMLQDMVATLQSHLRDTVEGLSGVPARLQALARRARQLACAMDFKPLYDRQRRLMHIGLLTDSQQLDRNHYDLLASEARLASLFAIAKGDVPVEHWGALGRPFFGHGNLAALRSWSGSMFEYLMPTLVLQEPLGSALQQANASAVAEQQREALPYRTPWGISECAVAAQDHTLAYQYGPQGVPRLALRRTPTDERVLAPYASALALLVAPAAAVANLRALETLGARRAFGFIDAIDFSPKRQTAGGTHTLVETHMAHHQAMMLVAACAVLTDGAPQGWAQRDPHLRAVSSLLHERAPRETAVLRDPPKLPRQRRAPREPLVHTSAPLQDALLPTHWLGNGRYALTLRSNGAGSSHWQGQGLTRWRDDLLRDDRGAFLYLQREVAGGGGPFAIAPGPRHSLTTHPAADPHAHYRCRMQPDRVVFDCGWPDLQTCTAVWISPEDDCELRQVELTNTGDVPLYLRLSLAAEPTLAPLRADEAHPAFSNFFVQASWDAAERALYLRRKPRLATEREVRAVHFLAQAQPDVSDVQPCADRLRWLGRYGSPAQPVGDGAATWWPDGEESGPEPVKDGADGNEMAARAATAAAALPGRLLDTGLDPMAVITAHVRLAPGATTKLTFVSAAAATQDELDALVDKYRQAHHVERASSMSHTMASILLYDTRLDADSWAAMLHLQTLLSAVPTRELSGELQPTEHCDKRLLWRHGIGGDRPILCIDIHNETGLALVHLMVRAMIAWTAAGQGVDLVVVNGEPSSYLTPVQHHLQLLLQRQPAVDADGSAANATNAPAADRPTLRLLRSADLSADERYTLHALARVRLQADGRPLSEQVQRWLDRQQHDRDARDRVGTWPVVQPWATAQARLPATAPKGAFAADDGRYDFAVSPSQHPARPWINVLANADFGCHVSEMAAGPTWAGNSRLHQITRWSNDPVNDPAGEWLLLHDVAGGRVWPLGRALQGAGPRSVEHGIGFTRMRQHVAGLEVTLQWCVDAKQAVKQVQLRLRSLSADETTWRVVALAEWMLGQTSADRLSVATARLNLAAGERLPRDAVAVLGTQLDASGGFGGATAWMAFRPVAGSARQSDEWTCDRREFHDSQGRLVVPTRLQQGAGHGLDPCGAVARTVVLQAQGEVELTLLLGHLGLTSADRSGAAEPIAAALAFDPEQRLAAQRQVWRDQGRALQVRTPDPAFDALVNHWLPYQTVACRLWARAGFYQAGGAFGFRDQLQDAMSMVTLTPALLRQQLLANAARQFPEGDVQHWWHLPGGAGVRTHFSDDRLWLPFALAHFVQRTGDHALLDERIPFLQGKAVPAGAEDIYETPAMDGERATLYEHAARAIDRSLATGVHGLPLMGTGDWNDGMNRVGHLGQGESVWLAWFLCAVIDGMVPLAHGRGESARAAHWQRARAGWVQALDSQAWDGGWYKRAFFDDGTPLGTRSQAECRIDLIAQAWAVLSGAGDPARAQQALAAADSELWDAKHGLLRLLHPPLQYARPEAGYIQAYPAGVRENGGQYSHGATWAVMAAAKLHQPERAWRMWQAISPAHRWQDAVLGPAYGGEPYVVAGDICSASPWAGRCGWSWYTGASGWLWRAAVESLCGLQTGPESLRFDPCLPPGWDRVELRVAHGAQHEHQHRFVICGSAAAAAQAEAEPGCLGPLPCATAIPLSGLLETGFYVLRQDARAEPASAGVQQSTEARQAANSAGG